MNRLGSIIPICILAAGLIAATGDSKDLFTARQRRFVEVYCSSGSKWDAHTHIEENHTKMCKISDKPVAGLLADPKGRGLVDSTLVIWVGEFGRTPFNESGDGRDHNPWGFTKEVLA
jgi:uncharacterized protein (DUF1501 family)